MTSRQGLIGFTGAALFVVTDGPLFFLAYSVLDRPEPPSWHDEVVAGGLALTASGCGMLALWRLWHSRLKQPRPPRPLAATAVVAFVAAIAASAIWSIETLDTAWRSVIYAGLAVLAWLLADLEDDANQALTLMAAAGTAASLLAVAAGAGAAFDPNRDWQGIYMSRNLLAPVAAVGVIAGIRMLCLPERPARLAGAALAVGSVLAMVGAGSRTAWLALAAALGLVLVFGTAAASRARGWAPRWTWTILAGGGLVVVGAGVAVAAASWSVSTLSQRREIWSLVWDRVLERPWGGYGFFAFWEVPELVQDHVLLQRGSAHNSLVETALGLGVVGTVPFVVLVVLAAVNAGRGLWLRPSADTGMWAAVTVFVLFENMTESFVLWFSHIWVLMLVAALRRSAPGTGAGGRCPLSVGAGS